MIPCPLFRAAIAGDFGVEDEKATLQFGHVRTHTLTMPLEQRAPLHLR